MVPVRMRSDGYGRKQFCYRTSRKIGGCPLGSIIMAHEMEQVFLAFAAAFSGLVRSGRTPLEAMNDFFAITLGFAEGKAK